MQETYTLHGPGPGPGPRAQRGGLPGPGPGPRPGRPTPDPAALLAEHVGPARPGAMQGIGFLHVYKYILPFIILYYP